MTSIKKTAFAGIFALAALSTTTGSASAMTYDWTLTGNSTLGSGQLTTGIADNGGYDITSFTGEIGGETVIGLVGGNYGYSTGDGSYPSIISPTGKFWYDNILYPASNSDKGALLDNSGLLFSLTDHVEANIYGNSPSDYGYYSYNGSYDTQFASGMTFSVDPVPEPASMALLGAGLFGVGVIRRRRQSVAR